MEAFLKSHLDSKPNNDFKQPIMHTHTVLHVKCSKLGHVAAMCAPLHAWCVVSCSMAFIVACRLPCGYACTHRGM